MRIGLLFLLFAASPAWAGDYVMAKGSSLGFTATYQGEVFSGRFQRFTPHIRFDPASAKTCLFDVRIALASANTDNSERDELLHGSDFFDALAVPDARYLVKSCRALGGNKFVADGQLQLRGISKAIALTFTWTAGNPAVLSGTAMVNRLDFNVGSGDWADIELLPNAVKVKTRLLLSAKP